jgi:hypothetical protein
MAYKKEDMIKQCLEVIKKNNLTRINYIFSYVPFSRSLFYQYNLDKLDSIKNAIQKRRVHTKVDLINSWIKSKSAALQIAAYRLLADEEEFERLVMNQIDHTSKGDKIQPIEFTVAKQETTDKIKKLIDESMLN